MQLKPGRYQATVYVTLTPEVRDALPTIYLKLGESVVFNSVIDRNGVGFVKVEYLDLDHERKYADMGLEVFLNCFEYVDDLDLGESAHN